MAEPGKKRKRKLVQIYNKQKGGDAAATLDVDDEKKRRRSHDFLSSSDNEVMFTPADIQMMEDAVENAITNSTAGPGGLDMKERSRGTEAKLDGEQEQGVDAAATLHVHNEEHRKCSDEKGNLPEDFLKYLNTVNILELGVQRQEGGLPDVTEVSTAGPSGLEMKEDREEQRQCTDDFVNSSDNIIIFTPADIQLMEDAVENTRANSTAGPDRLRKKKKSKARRTKAKLDGKQEKVGNCAAMHDVNQEETANDATIPGVEQQICGVGDAKLDGEHNKGGHAEVPEEFCTMFEGEQENMKKQGQSIVLQFLEKEVQADLANMQYDETEQRIKEIDEFKLLWREILLLHTKVQLLKHRIASATGIPTGGSGDTEAMPGLEHGRGGDAETALDVDENIAKTEAVPDVEHKTEAEDMLDEDKKWSGRDEAMPEIEEDDEVEPLNPQLIALEDDVITLQADIAQCIEKLEGYSVNRRSPMQGSSDSEATGDRDNEIYRLSQIIVTMLDDLKVAHKSLFKH